MKQRPALTFRLPATWSKAQCDEFLRGLDRARATAGERYLNDFVFKILKQTIDAHEEFQRGEKKRGGR